MFPEIVVVVSFLQLDLSLALSCSLNKNFSAPLLFSQQDYCSFLLLLASHQKASWPLTKISSTSSSSFCSWHLTKIFPTTQEWVRPFSLINLMREGEEFSNLTDEIRLDGWLRFGVSSLTLTLIIKLSFNLHLTN
jgi:hypothetical protein